MYAGCVISLVGAGCLRIHVSVVGLCGSVLEAVLLCQSAMLDFVCVDW